MNLDTVAQLCRTFEGLCLKPYPCPAGIPTIGYGSIYYADGRRVTLNDPPITREDADKLLMHTLTHDVLPGVLRLCPILASHENRLNAILDFTFNLGAGRLQTSTLRRKINAQDWDGAKEQLMLWVRGGGRVLPGLVKRRRFECLLMG